MLSMTKIPRTSLDVDFAEELNDEARFQINLQAAYDFSKRSIIGAFIILMAMGLSMSMTTIRDDAPTIVYFCLTLLLLSIGSRFFILKKLPTLDRTNLTRWRSLFSSLVFATGAAWGIYTAANIHLYSATTASMVILMFTIGIAGGSAISLFIWKKLAHLYLVAVFLPTYVVALLYWTEVSASILFAFSVYFIFLYVQVMRSNKEYWLALCNNKLLENRTRQLEQQAAELVEAKTIAEQASVAKSEFLSSMSHELRTPLNAIIGFSQLLLTDNLNKPSDEQAENLRYIYDAGEHLLALINQVLDLAKIESGKVELQSQAVSVTKLINECHPLITSLAQKDRISVDMTSLGNPIVMADPLHLKQVLLNLLSNAIKYNKPKGDVTVVSEELPATIKISIIDTGIGIASELQQLVFSSFLRLGQENSSIQGTGIGLAISQKLIEAMGGQIGMSSMEGEGSTFWIELPRADTDHR